jgi:AbrB family looped-hinge helix DNA binding protein
MGFNITITSKGQMTIPKHLRDQLNVKPGDKCYAWVRNGEMVIIPCNKRVAELAKVLAKPPAGPQASQRQIDDTVIDAAVERYESASWTSSRQYRSDGSLRLLPMKQLAMRSISAACRTWISPTRC